MQQSIAARRSRNRPLLFTSLTGETIEVYPEELAMTLPPILPIASLDGYSDIENAGLGPADGNVDEGAIVGHRKELAETVPASEEAVSHLVREENKSPASASEEDHRAGPELHSPPPPPFPRTVLKEVHVIDDGTEVLETLAVQVDGPGSVVEAEAADILAHTEDGRTPPPSYSESAEVHLVGQLEDQSPNDTPNYSKALTGSSALTYLLEGNDKEAVVINDTGVSKSISAQVDGAGQSVEEDYNPPVNTSKTEPEALAGRPDVSARIDKDAVNINTEEASENVSAQVDGPSQFIEDLNGDGPIDTLDGFITPPAPRSPRPRCGTPLIEVVTPDELPTKPRQQLPIQTHHGRVVNRLSKRSSNSGVRVQMVYNEWGDLVPENTINVPPESDKLNVKQLLRAIKKGYNHELRRLLSKLINPPPSGGQSVLMEDQIWTFRLSTWDLRLRTPQSSTPHTSTSPPFALTQRRVLEVGCSEGDWCFAFKKHQPDWVVNGIDETEHWACFERGIPFRDFAKKLDDSPGWMQPDYFTGHTPVQSYPEFTARNINHLTMHESPIPANFYEFVRGREIFDRVESYKMFLEDVRCILKPGGVVEFIEVDPRPRINLSVDTDGDREKSRDGKSGKKRSSAPTDWTDCIVDRYKDPHDEEIARDVPGWLARVHERLKATMRPQDGVAGANLKSWLEGAGFWDVKEYVLPIPVGGSTESGLLVKKYLLYQLELENAIPKLKAELPEVEVAAFDGGKYHLNIHVVTGRKPVTLRTGDMQSDGRRTEMTNSTYDAMARFEAIKSSQWKRFDIDGDLPGIMQNLSTLLGAPEQPQTLDIRVDQHIRHTELSSVFNAPPFVTLEESKVHISESGLEKDGRSQSPRFGLPRLG